MCSKIKSCIDTEVPPCVLYSSYLEQLITAIYKGKKSDKGMMGDKNCNSYNKKIK